MGCFPIMFLQQEKGEHFSQVSSFGLLLLIVALETPRVAITAAEDDLKLVPHFFPWETVNAQATDSQRHLWDIFVDMFAWEGRGTKRTCMGNDGLNGNSKSLSFLPKRTAIYHWRYHAHGYKIIQYIIIYHYIIIEDCTEWQALYKTQIICQNFVKQFKHLPYLWKTTYISII